MALGMRSEYLCCLIYPVLGIISPLGICAYIELVNEGLNVTLVIGGQDTVLKVLSYSQLLAVYLGASSIY